jgi:hypothetical protein
MLPREQFNNIIISSIIDRFEFNKTWVNWMHFLIIGPLLVYISLKGNKTPKGVFMFLVLLGLSVIGAHCYFLIMKYQGKSTGIEGFSGSCPMGSYTCA